MSTNMATAKFSIGDRVKIDSQGIGTITGIWDKLTGEISYLVCIDGTDYEGLFTAERLVIVPKNMFGRTATSAGKQQTTKRFETVNDDDIENIIQDNQNRNTAKKTLYTMNLVRDFLQTQHENRSLENIPPCELSKILCKFFVGIKKKDGSDPEPLTIRSYVSSIDRYLKRKEYGFTISYSPEFSKVRDVVKSRQIDLKKKGKGNLPQRSDPISDEEINTLWETGQFGAHSPHAIINTLWFFNTVHFGLRGADEHRSMSWGDVTLSTDSSGQQFLSFNEKQTKTRTGSNPKDARDVTPKMWQNSDPDRCVVHIYKVFAAKRPDFYSSDVDPFYIAPNTLGSQTQYTDANTWFRRQPIGDRKLSTLMQTMCDKLPSTHRRLTNHSARKYLIQKLSDNNIPPNQIMQVSGHKNMQSINNYSKINENQHRYLSNVLSDTSNSHSALVPFSSSNSISGAPMIPRAVSCTATSSSEMQLNVTGGVHTIFGGPITGGQITVNVYPGSGNLSSPKQKYRRIARPIIESDESSQEL